MDAERADFFISYASADRRWAEWIAWQLDDAGYAVVSMAWDFRPSQNFVLNMQRALEASARLLAVLSPSYLSALYTQPEWAAAIAEDPTGARGKLLAVRVRACEPKGLWHAIARIELDGLDDAAAREALLAGVKLDRAKPPGPPAFPAGAPRAVDREPRFPGTLPAIWNVPHQRNPSFTGREALLARLAEALEAGPAAIAQAIHGLGGVGKTQLAVEFCYRHAADYDLVWWIAAEEPAGLAADLADLAGPLDLPVEDAEDQGLIVEAVRRWLERHGGWLLVFDDAPEPAELRDYLPRGAAGHVVLTSRNPTWRGVASPLAVKVWAREESVGFLLRRTGLDDEAGADALAGELGDYPLALEHAAAYVERTGCTVDHYRELLNRSHAALWERARVPHAYHSTIAVTWKLAFDRLREETPAAADLLTLCAFLAPDEIPRDAISHSPDLLPERLAAAVRDPLALDDAISALRRYSLIEVSRDALAVHRLVQALTRDRLAGAQAREGALAALRIAGAAFPPDPSAPTAWPKCTRLLPHALAAAEHAEALGIEPATVGDLLRRAGTYLWHRAALAEARIIYERALAIDQAALGTDHPSVAWDANNLGLALHDLGDLEGARSHYERARAIHEAHGGPDHPDVASTLTNLGSVLQDLGDLAGARKCFERALAIDEAAFGTDHPNVARDVNGLGSVLRALGDLEGAREHFELALGISQAALGPDHPRVATALNNVGAALQGVGDLEGARKHYERALAIDAAALGPQHPNLAVRANNLALVLQELGDLEDAKEHIERAIAIDEATYGTDHPNTATHLNTFGPILQDLGHLVEARARLERALAIDEDAFGTDHPSIARDVNNLGRVLHDLGDLPGARKCFARALRIWRQFLGDEHPHAQLARRNLEFVERQLREGGEE